MWYLIIKPKIDHLKQVLKHNFDKAVNSRESSYELEGKAPSTQNSEIDFQISIGNQEIGKALIQVISQIQQVIENV